MTTNHTPQIALPVRFANGRLATVEQDSPDHVFQRVEAILRYTPGDLEATPQFGRRDQAFRRGGPDREQVLNAVERWAPDARVRSDVDLSALGELAATIRVDVLGRHE